ncbi:MAG: hypothetical protein HYZ53_30320 [Planctomycetes bacterium]|nr:hypothetical protein [Planctomycetota bacterium]
MATRMFGTAGIRGLTNVEITPLLALRMAHAFGTYLGGRGRMLVGRDTRYGAEMLSAASAAGLMSAGMRVVDVGVIPTGGFATYLTRRKFDGGVLITGSHTPNDRIGFIAMMSDGAYVPEAVAKALEAAYEKDQRARIPVKHEIGAMEPAELPLELYLQSLLESVDIDLIRKRKFRVLVDPVNGAAAGVIQDFLRRLDCQLLEMNGRPSPVFGRPSEPRASCLGPAAEAVLAAHCDLGLATDVDADRILFIDDKGNILSEDLTGALFADDLLPRMKRKVCVIPINSSGLIELICARHGARIVDCPPGQPATVEAVKAADADYAYEESGKYYFCRQALWCDALLAAGKMLELLARKDLSLSNVSVPYPRFHQVKRTIHCDDRVKVRAMELVRELWEKELLEGRQKDVTVDGLKRVYQDNSWLLLRKSGTEPLIRVYSDATTRERADELVRKGDALLRRALKLAEGEGAPPAGAPPAGGK